MSRRQLSFVVVALASIFVSACGVASTAPRHDDTTSIIINGGGGMQR